MAKFRGISPKVKIERDYYNSVRKGYLIPYMNGLQEELVKLGEYATTEAWLSTISRYTDNWTRYHDFDGDFMALDSSAVLESRAGKMAAIASGYRATDEWKAIDVGADDLFSLFDEFVNEIKDKDIPDNATDEELVEYLRRKWSELTSSAEMRRRAKEFAEQANPLQGDLKDKVDAQFERLFNIILFRMERRIRIAKEVHGIIFRGGEGTQTAKRLREYLWSIRVDMQLWIGGIQRVQGYMSPGGAARLMEDLISYYSDAVAKRWDQMLDDLAKQASSKVESIERSVKRLTVDPIVAIDKALVKHLEAFAERFKRFSQIADRVYLYSQPGGHILLFEDIMRRYTKRIFDKWLRIKKYIDFNNNEIDLDLLYKDYLQPYIERIDQEWDRWERRTRFIDVRNREIDLDLLIADLHSRFMNDAWDRWDELEKRWGVLNQRWKQGGWITLLDDIIVFAAERLEKEFISRAAKRVREPAQRAVMQWLDRSTKTANAAMAKDFIRVARVDIRPALRSAPLNDVLRERAFENIRLIKTIPDRFKDDLTTKLIEGEKKAPLDLQARAKMFRRTGKSAGYNLRRITRDQSNKLVGQINQANQQALGINTYRWETSDDDRVRPTHRTKDGLIFRWDDPPPDTGHPGDDIQCRCIALPVVSIATLRKRHERISKKRERQKEREEEAFEQGEEPFVAEVNEDEAEEAAKSGDYEIVPVAGKPDKFHLVPKNSALYARMQREDDDDDTDYGLAEEDFVDEPDYGRSDDEDDTLEEMESDFLEGLRYEFSESLMEEGYDFDGDGFEEEVDRRIAKWKDHSGMTEEQIDKDIEAGWMWGDRSAAFVLAKYGTKRVNEARLRAGQRTQQQREVEKARQEAQPTPPNPLSGLTESQIFNIEGAIEEGDWEYLRARYSDDIIELVRGQME